MELKDAAISYAKAGWFIFPLLAREKMPAISRKDGGKGLHQATNDVDRIEKWWTKHPDHNIGLSVGASGLYVIDVDGERGENALKDLLEQHGPLPDTLCQITGKGFHYFFKHPEDLELGNTASKLAPGIDTRGYGGYVVLPPSIHPDGGVYAWKDQDIVPAQLPEWISEGVKQVVWIPPTHTPSAYSINVHPYVRRVWENVQGTLQSAQPGTRNNALNIAAVKMGHWIASNSIDRNRVELELELIARNLGLTDHEIRETLRSGIEKGLESPAYPPENTQSHNETSSQHDARQSEGVVAIQRGSTFGRKEVKYLWGKRLPIGKLTILAGPSGIGKSFISIALAANITAGKFLLDGGTHVDGEVLFCTYEDDVEDTVGPRADGLGVDLDRCHFITGVDTEHGERAFGPQDVYRIIDFLKGSPDLRLIVIDPLGSFMGSGTDVNRENEARAVLSTLVKTAADTDTAVMMVAHYNKGTESSDPLHRIAGSQGITALPRSVLAVEWGENGERLVRHLKSSTSKTASTVGYRFEDTFAWTRVVREDDELTRWLLETLDMNEGRLLDEEIRENAHIFGITDLELETARMGAKIFIDQGIWMANPALLA